MSQRDQMEIKEVQLYTSPGEAEPSSHTDTPLTFFLDGAESAEAPLNSTRVHVHRQEWSGISVIYLQLTEV